VKYEVEVRVAYRNDAGKIVRIDKVTGTDPILQRFLTYGSEPVGARYKQAARERPPLPIDPHKNYGPKDVAAFLDISYDSAIREIEKMPGCTGLGKRAPRFKRTKRLLRISGMKLKEWMRNHPANPLA
jgi:hypothetical protein